MGIDRSALNAILLSCKYIKNKTNLLTLGRQQIHTIKELNIDIGNKFNIDLSSIIYGNYCENFFRSIGFENVESIDNSNYENAKYIYNLNYPNQRILTYPLAQLTDLGSPIVSAGARAMINDSTVPASTNFGAIAVGGGANVVPVFSDGTNWLIG